jgi:hypothetical protein
LSRSKHESGKILQTPATDASGGWSLERLRSMIAFTNSPAPRLVGIQDVAESQELVVDTECTRRLLEGIPLQIHVRS